MKELNFEKMEELKGGVESVLGCAAGIGVLAGIAGWALFGTASFAATALTGAGKFALGTLTVGAIAAVDEYC